MNDNIKITPGELLADGNERYTAIVLNEVVYFVARDRDADRTPYLVTCQPTDDPALIGRAVEVDTGDKIAFDGYGDVWTIPAPPAPAMVAMDRC
jgi:hypothetical protein